MKYYYITFESPILYGHTVLPHKDTDDGFNVADAHRHLSHHTGHPVIVRTWHEINEKRYREMLEYLTKTYYHDETCPNHPKNQGPRLGVFQGGKRPEEPSKPAGDLKPVPPPEDPAK